MRNLFLALCFISCLFVVNSIKGEDWPTWRGVNRDGISQEKNWDPKKISEVLWEKDVGVGYSSVISIGDKIWTMGNKDGKDIIYCLDAKSGDEIWKFSYNCSKGKGYFGPRATPVISKGAIFTLSLEGQVYCLDAKTGKEIWSQNITKLGVKNLSWKFSSPITIIGKLAIINGGKHGIALDVKSGKKVWGSSGQGGYASPVPVKNGKQVAIFGFNILNVVDAKSGKIKASYPWETKYNINAADPIVLGDEVFISSGYGKGCALLKLKGDKLTKLWQNTSMKSHFSTPVLLDGYLYGVDGNTGRGIFTCVDFKSGKVMWQEKSLKFGSLIVADGKVIYLNEKGELTIFKASPKGFSKISSARVLKGAGKCWTMPIISNGRIFCRGSKGKLACLNVKK